MIESMRDVLGRSENCPPVETLIETAKTVETRQHVELCAHCRTELALAEAFLSGSPRTEELASVNWIEARLRGGSAAPALTPGPLSFWTRVNEWVSALLPTGSYRALAAGMAMILLLVGVFYFRGAATHELRPPSPDGLVWRSGGIRAISPAGDLAAAPAEFQWEATPNAAVYHVYLMEVDRTVIWSADSKQTSVQAPAEVKAQFHPGRAFHWHVTASDAAGQTIASSDLQSFHIQITRP